MQANTITITILVPNTLFSDCSLCKFMILARRVAPVAKVVFIHKNTGRGSSKGRRKKKKETK